MNWCDENRAIANQMSSVIVVSVCLSASFPPYLTSINQSPFANVLAVLILFFCCISCSYLRLCRIRCIPMWHMSRTYIHACVYWHLSILLQSSIAFNIASIHEIWQNLLIVIDEQSRYRWMPVVLLLFNWILQTNIVDMHSEHSMNYSLMTILLSNKYIFWLLSKMIDRYIHRVIVFLWFHILFGIYT